MTEQEKWNAVANNDVTLDGRLYYAVKSTGVFCRPSCKSRRPARENTVFFDTAEEAMAEGFRPCKRCRPDIPVYQPHSEIVREAKRLIERFPIEKQRLAGELAKLGVSGRRLVQLYQQEYGMTPTAYADRLRVETAKEQLRDSKESVTDIAYLLGFESLSAFFAFFRKHTGSTPREFRNGLNEMEYGDAAYGIYDTALGQFTIVCRDDAVVAVRFGAKHISGAKQQKNMCTDKAAGQIEEYLAGHRKRFDLPLAPSGTAGMGGASRNSLRRNAKLQRDRAGHRPAGRKPRGGHGEQ